MEKTYVFEGKEVFLTGRKALKPGRRGKVKELFEIKPIKYKDTPELSGVNAAEWVSLKDLYEINDEEQ